jgi:hypothetical protein
MPEFRRGLGRFLPRAAERELFHPSLEDLRAEGVRGMRYRAAVIMLWLDCWRVWLTDSNPAKAGHHNPAKAGHHNPAKAGHHGLSGLVASSRIHVVSGFSRIRSG